MRSSARRAFGVRAAVAAALLALSTVLALPSTAAAPAVPTLGATNEITGTAMGSKVVRLARTTTFRGEDFKSIKIKGAGRAVGMSLIQQGAPAGQGVSLTGLLMTFCGKPGCTGDRTTAFGSQRTAGDGTLTLPAGLYRLYLIADGKPTRVTFTMPGQTGSMSVHPDTPERLGPVDTKDVRRTTVGDAEVLYASGTSIELESPAPLAVYAIQIPRSREWVHGRSGVCSYGSADPSPDLAYHPGCPTGTEQAALGDTVVNPGIFELDKTYFFIFGLTPGRNTFGGYLDKVGISDDVRSAAFVLDYTNAEA